MRAAKIQICLLLTGFGGISEGNEYIGHYVEVWIHTEPRIIKHYLRGLIRGPRPNPTAAYILGMIYLEGTILKKDLRTADCFLTMAANAGLPAAINAIGDSYYTGDTREKNISLAALYYERAAKMGFGPAQFNAGVVFLRTGTTKRDLRKAILYLDKASKNSNDLGEITKSALQYKKDAEERLKKLM
ncbi:MAG: sel1 repeat family protein [Holosporales bacterium]|jgi:TPR repeat protein|nr:sel1 repeat family protein [Holosporales bacterium]